MPTEYQEADGDVFNYYEGDWLELLDPAAEDNISGSAMEATLTGLVAFNKIRSCARHFLGHSSCDAAAPYRLYRDPPAAHPRWPMLRAHGISFRGLNPQSNAANDNGEPNTESPFDPLLRAGKFEMAVVTVRYRSFGRVRFLPDTDVEDYTDEWKRMVQWSTAPRIEALSADGASQLRFAEGGSWFDVTGPTGGANGTPFPAPIAVLLSKCAFVMTWLHVPHDYISSDPDILVPDRFLNVMGKVNGSAFLGFDAGVLLAEPATFEPVLLPVPADDQYDLITAWNVHQPFTYFNPENAASGSTHKGHNLMPFRNGGFYLATRNGLTTGQKLLREADFNLIFKHVGAP